MLCSRSQRPRAHCSKIPASPEIAAFLTPGERLLTEPVYVHGWRYESAEVKYERRTLMVGGPVLFALTGIGSAIRNRSVRKAAESQAAARWRPLGPLSVLATTNRLFVLHQGAWWSVWYTAITSAISDDQELRLTFADAPPYLLNGAVAELSTAITAGRRSPDA